MFEAVSPFDSEETLRMFLPFWSCDPDFQNKPSVPLPIDAQRVIWLRFAKGFGEV